MHAPIDFKISDSAMAQIEMIMGLARQSDRAREWITVIVWGTTEFPIGHKIAEGPEVTYQDKADIAPDLIVSIQGLAVLFGNPEYLVRLFDGKTLDFAPDKGFLLTPPVGAPQQAGYGNIIIEMKRARQDWAD